MKKILLIITIAFCIFQMVVLADVITIGNPAIIRPGGNAISSHTTIFPIAADGTGTLTSIEIWAQVTLTNVEIATFVEGAANTFSTRDWEAIADVTAGAKRTFTVDIDVVEGDYIGIHCDAGTIFSTTTTGLWWRYVSADKIPCADTVFTAMSERVVSLYGTGETVAVGWDGPFNTTAITKWNNIEITKWNTIE